MKIAALIARILLGLVFVVFGLNGIHPFLPMGPMPTGNAGQFIGAMMQSHYSLIVALLQVIGGVLLLVNRYVTLGLVILGPVIVNIFLFHALMEPKGLPVAIVVVLLWFILAFHARRNLSGIFAPGIEA
jgi:putative oxidoreductase